MYIFAFADMYIYIYKYTQHFPFIDSCNVYIIYDILYEYVNKRKPLSTVNIGSCRMWILFEDKYFLVRKIWLWIWLYWPHLLWLNSDRESVCRCWYDMIYIYMNRHTGRQPVSRSIYLKGEHLSPRQCCYCSCCCCWCFCGTTKSL